MEFSSFSQEKGLTWYENYKNILNWHAKKDDLQPPIGVTIDLTTSCNLKCRGCLSPTTKILMADMTLKQIKDVKKGDIIIGSNNKKLVKSKVLKKFEIDYTGELLNFYTKKSFLATTPNHKIWHTRCRWKQAINFKKGDKINEYPNLNEDLTKQISFKIGWLAGMCDGDGCFWTLTKHQRRQFRLYLRDKEGYDRFQKYFKELKIKGLYLSNYYNKDCYFDNRWIIRDKSEKLKAIYLTRDEQVRRFENIIREDKDSFIFSIGYLSGIFDSEGSYDGSTIRIAQKKVSVINRIKKHLKKIGLKHVYEKDYGFRLLGGMSTTIFFFNTMQPAIKRKYEKVFGTKITSTDIFIKYEKENYVGKVYDLKTETENYFANGILVHNCNAVRSWDKGVSLPTNEVIRIIDYLSEWKKEKGNLYSICFAGGGEPTLHPGFNEIIQYASIKGFEVGLSTNGTQLHIEEVRDTIVKYADFCGVSIDAGSLKGWLNYKQVSKGYEDLMQGLRNTILLIKKLGSRSYKKREQLDFVYKFLITPDNQEEILEAAMLAKNIGFNSFFVRPAAMDRIESFGMEDKNLDKELIFNQIEKAKEVTMSNGDFNVYSSFGRVNPKTLGKIQKFKKCYATPILIQICADGYVYQCIDSRYINSRRMTHWSEVRKFWGSKTHKKVVNKIDTKTCPRCAFGIYNEQIEKAVIGDDLWRDFP